MIDRKPIHHHGSRLNGSKGWWFTQMLVGCERFYLDLITGGYCEEWDFGIVREVVLEVASQQEQMNGC